MNALWIVYLVGLIIATFQDFKRREIDDWLNLFLFFSGVGFLLLSNSLNFILSFSFFVFIMMLVSYLFYYARIFSGGDSKLLFALSPLLFSVIFNQAIMNLGIFIFLLFFSGSVYSLFFILFFILKDFKKLKPVLIKNIKKFKILFLAIVLLSFFGLLYKDIFYFGIFFIFILLLYIVSLSLEGVSLTKKVLAKDLAEGDWIAKKFKFNGKTFDYSWDGLSEKDIKILKNYKKYIEVKDGIPYALSFLIAFFLFLFKDLILQFL